MDLRNNYLVIREIQDYLRELYRNGYIKTSIIPTGEYDDKTREAVREFQSLAGLPADGSVNLDTWTSLTAAAGESRKRRAASHPIFPFERLLVNGSVSPGDKSDMVLIIQIMLKELAAYDFDSITLNGRYDDATESAIRRFQEIHMLPVTGIVNKETWNELAGVYNKELKMSV